MSKTKNHTNGNLGRGLKYKAFTLIELLAVIVILAIIALIATPIILNIIEKSRKSAFLDSAYGIENSASAVFMESILNGEPNAEKTYVFDGNKPEGLNYSGTSPKGGRLVVRTDGTILLALHNGTWCAKKGMGDKKITLTKYESETCVIPENAKDPVITLKGDAIMTLKVGEAYTEPGVEAKTVDGSILEYEIEIIKDEEVVEKVDTNIIGTYIITYKATSNQKLATITRKVTIKAENADKSNANKPQLNGLVPIKWNGSTWIVADTSNVPGENQWYDYDAQMWANAASVTEEYRNKKVGSIIPEEAVLAYFVWIPRYEYMYTNLGTNYAGGTVEQPGEIKINFISKDVTMSSSSEYKVHPAFTFGETELSGIWVGKFETTGEGNMPTIKPNLASIRSQNASTQFITAQKFSSSGNCYGINLSADAHMMKNSEWGAVTYLSQSKYGKYGNNSYTGVNKEVYQNRSDSYITGCSSGAPGGSILDYGCQYTYEKDGTGTGASTTGTIYGVYDMSGGAYEYVMGVYRGSGAGNPWGASNDKTNYAGFTTAPAAKYYDEYKTTSATTACSNGICYGDALIETAAWYHDYDSFISARSPWFKRGGQYGDTTYAGIFFFHPVYGEASGNCSFRVVFLGE